MTANVVKALAKQAFAENYLKAIAGDGVIMETPCLTAPGFAKTVEQCIQERLTVVQEGQLLAAAERNTIGPSVTDMPVRQVVYFGDNALDQSGPKATGSSPATMTRPSRASGRS